MSVMGALCIGKDLRKRQVLEKSCDINNVIWNKCCASKAQQIHKMNVAEFKC